MQLVNELVTIAGFAWDDAVNFAENQPNNARAFVEKIKKELQKDEPKRI